MAETTGTTTTATEPGTAQQTNNQNTDPTTQTPNTGNQQTPNTDPTGDDKKYSDADLDKIINQKFADWQKKQQKAVDEAKKLAGMSAQQKVEHQLEEMQKQYNDLLKQNTLSEMTKTARAILSESDITVSDDLLAVLVSTDAEKTNTAVSSFVDMFKKEVDKAVKEALKGNPPKAGSTKSGTMTKEQIMNIKDPVERQKMMMQNKEMFGL